MLITILTNDQQSSSGQASFNSSIDPPADSKVKCIYLELKKNHNLMVNIIYAHTQNIFPWQSGPYHTLLHPLHAHVAKVSLSAK